MRLLEIRDFLRIDNIFFKKCSSFSEQPSHFSLFSCGDLTISMPELASASHESRPAAAAPTVIGLKKYEQATVSFPAPA